MGSAGETSTTMEIDADSEIAVTFCDTPTYSRLRSLKNTLVGNSSAKAQLAISGPSAIRLCVSSPFCPQSAYNKVP